MGGLREKPGAGHGSDLDKMIKKDKYRPDLRVEIWLEAAWPKAGCTPGLADVINMCCIHKALPDQITTTTTTRSSNRGKQVPLLVDISDLLFDSVQLQNFGKEDRKCGINQTCLAESFLLKTLRGDHILWETLSWSMVPRPDFTLALQVDPSQTPTPRPHPRPINSRSWRGRTHSSVYYFKAPQMILMYRQN